MRLLELLHKVVAVGSVLSLLGMICCVLIQVFARFFLESAPSWTEELSRIFFIYSVAFGIGLAFKNEAIIKLDIIKKYTSEKINATLQIGISVMMALFGVIIFWYAIEFAKTGFSEKSPAMEINMIYAFSAIPIMMLSIFIFSTEQIINQYNKLKV